jgi:hypothetical protein
MNALQRMPRNQLLAITAVLILVAMMFANFLDIGGSDDGEDHGSAKDFVILSAIGIGLTVLLLYVVIPRLRSGNVAVVFGVLALITLPVFWSTLPFVFGAAAIAASSPRDDQPTSDIAGGVKAAVILGLLAWAAGLLACIIG